MRMSTIQDVYKSQYLEKEDIHMAEILVSSLDREQADAILDAVSQEVKNLGKSSGFVLDVRKVNRVSSPALGVLMKSLSLVPKTRDYMVLVMEEALLQEIMIQHPEMFDYYAVFHTPEEAVSFIRS